jgi:Carboxypeptidase regulatory-like domain
MSAPMGLPRRGRIRFTSGPTLLAITELRGPERSPTRSLGYSAAKCVLSKLASDTAIRAYADSAEVESTNGAYLLDDGGDPNPQYGPPEPVSAAHPGKITDNDTPAVWPTGPNADNTIRLQKTDSFKTYLMYKPFGDNSIWVTLQVINWSLSRSATKTTAGGIAKWSMDPGSVDPEKDPKGSPSTVLPTWSSYVTAATWVAAPGIAGTVTDAQGNPVAGATVTASWNNGTNYVTATTDANGNYIIYGASTGGGTLTASKSGLQFNTSWPLPTNGSYSYLYYDFQADN